MVLFRPPAPLPRKRLLHYFRLPPSLNWACQLNLRPIIPDDPRRHSIDPILPHRLHHIPPLLINDGEPDEIIRARLRLHLQNLAAAAGTGDDDAAAAKEASPCILRERELFSDSTERKVAPDEKENVKPFSCESPPKLETRSRSLRLRGLAPEECAEAKTRRRQAMTKLSIPLGKKEIEKDILAMTGSKPSRRPKKRARAVQKELDELFPGMLLWEVTPEMYQVTQIQ